MIQPNKQRNKVSYLMLWYGVIKQLRSLTCVHIPLGPGACFILASWMQRKQLLVALRSEHVADETRHDLLNYTCLRRLVHHGICSFQPPGVSFSLHGCKKTSKVALQAVMMPDDVKKESSICKSSVVPSYSTVITATAIIWWRSAYI